MWNYPLLMCYPHFVPYFMSKYSSYFILNFQKKNWEFLARKYAFWFTVPSIFSSNTIASINNQLFIMVNISYNFKIYFFRFGPFFVFSYHCAPPPPLLCSIRGQRIERYNSHALCDQNCIANCWNTRPHQNVATSIWPLYLCPTEYCLFFHLQ